MLVGIIIALPVAFANDLKWEKNETYLWPEKGLIDGYLMVDIKNDIKWEKSETYLWPEQGKSDGWLMVDIKNDIKSKEKGETYLWPERGELMVDIKEPVLGSLLSPNLRPLKSKLPPWSRYIYILILLCILYLLKCTFFQKESLT